MCLGLLNGKRITSRELASSFGMRETMAEVIGKHRCRWLGHLARMGNDQILKQLLFGELVKTCPRHGPKKRWRDLAVMDVMTLAIEGGWFTIAQNRQQWSTICEQFYLSDVVEVCAANIPSQSRTFYVHAVILLSILEISQDMRLFVALNS